MNIANEETSQESQANSGNHMEDLLWMGKLKFVVYSNAHSYLTDNGVRFKADAAFFAMKQLFDDNVLPRKYVPAIKPC